MHSFRSRYYPKNKRPILILQEYALRQYAWFALLVMMLALMRMFRGEDVLIFTLIGMGVSIVLANFSALVICRKRMAEIFFINDHFTVLSVYDIAFGKEEKAFPVRYANPVRENDRLSFHYYDQVMNLLQGDWEAFDLLQTFLSQHPAA